MTLDELSGRRGEPPGRDAAAVPSARAAAAGAHRAKSWPSSCRRTCPTSRCGVLSAALRRATRPMRARRSKRRSSRSVHGRRARRRRRGEPHRRERSRRDAATSAPIPSLLATSAVHHSLARAGKRMRVGADRRDRRGARGRRRRAPRRLRRRAPSTRTSPSRRSTRSRSRRPAQRARRTTTSTRSTRACSRS